MSGDCATALQPGQQRETLSKKCVCVSVIPATQEAEAGESLELRSGGWSEHSNLDDRGKLYLKEKKKLAGHGGMRL